MNVTAFRHLSLPPKIWPALIAVGVNAIFFWGAVRATSVLPPERVNRMSAAAVDSCAPFSNPLVSRIEQGPERSARLERRQRRTIIDREVHNRYL